MVDHFMLGAHGWNWGVYYVVSNGELTKVGFRYKTTARRHLPAFLKSS